MTLVYDGYIKIAKVEDYERVLHPGAVAIVAYDDKYFYMTEQYRPAVGLTLRELSAGTREPGEPPLLTAQRELAEEIGATATSWREISHFMTSPGWTTEEVHLFAATGLTFGEQNLMGDEDIKVIKVPLTELDQALEKSPSAKCKIGLMWLRDELREEKESKARPTLARLREDLRTMRSRIPVPRPEHTERGYE